jgi:transcriptional regulator with XRE-family HTH domain
LKAPKLKELRERAFLTQADLAEKSGVAEATINRLELAKREARISTIRRLAQALGVQPKELIE